MQPRQPRIKPNTPHIPNKENIHRQRLSIGKGCAWELNVIKQLSNQHLPSANTHLNLYERVDHKTLELIQTYRNLDLPCLKTMSQEQCIVRYLNDPFFRKKMQYEFEYVSKLKSKTKLSLITQQQQEEYYNKVEECYGSKRKIRFKQIMANDAKHKIEEGEKYQNLLRKVSSQQDYRLSHEL